MKSLKTPWLSLAFFALTTSAGTQDIPTRTPNGMVDKRPLVTALTHATVHLDSHTTVPDGTVLIQDGRVLAAGANTRVPAGAKVLDLNGLHVYPGFVLLAGHYGLPKPPKKPGFSFFQKEVMQTTLTGPVNSNEAIKAGYDAVTDFHVNPKQAKELRAMGFGAVLSHRPDGIMQGTGVLADLSERDDPAVIIKPRASNHLSFDKGSSKQNFPVSLMGAAALLRQTWLDADWYARLKNPDFVDLDLKAVRENAQLPQIFHTGNWQQSVLAAKLGKESGHSFVLATAGDEYKNIEAIKNTGARLIVPLNFPKAPDIKDTLDAWNATTEDLLSWQAAPFNPQLLKKNGISFALTPGNQPKKFLSNLKTAIKKGLDKETALASLTEVPASMVSAADLGHLKPGARANLLIATGDLFDPEAKAQIAQNWVAGMAYDVTGIPPALPGQWMLETPDGTLAFNLDWKGGKAMVRPVDKKTPVKLSLSRDEHFLTLQVKPGKPADKAMAKPDSTTEENTKGNAATAPATALIGEYMGYATNRQHIVPVDSSQTWQLVRVGKAQHDHDEDKNTIEADKKTDPPELPKPFSAYGFNQAEKPKTLLIKNATVWTNTDRGVSENTDVLIKNGKIAAIGKNLKKKAEKIIDASGKHLSPGIIDEHSHIALLSINDIAVNSGMVRMADSLNPEDINIYRNLAGGVTAAQLLHGSANPIGGQSAIIKMRWGNDADGLLIKGADPFIKFALGENVKRSRAQQSIRYPLTRMGVEQVYRDQFAQARDYEKRWAEYNRLSPSKKKKTPPPRRDLALETLVEILNKDRFISCHSYVQSEITMLMRVAEDFGFRVNTFTHILEGYKVADKMKKHGAGGSTFSDWWAYKWEVNDAIPYNAAMLDKVGITTAVNSDDAEMARRLNQEAAKSIKYGGLSPEEALKLVTLNPAKLLHLDDRMGSIAVGKDADLVLWSDTPLSIKAKVEKTLVDGAILYDRERNAALEKRIAETKAHLIKLAQESPGDKKPVLPQPEKHFHCDSLHGYEYLLHTENSHD